LTRPVPLSILIRIVKVAEKAVFALTAAILDFLPGRVRRFVTDVSAFSYYCVSPRRRRNVRKNLSMMGATSSFGDIFPVFRNHTRNMIELLASSRWENAEIAGRIEPGDTALLDRVLEAGKGLIFATAHIGNWELPALYLSSLGYDLHVVAGIQMNRFLTGPLREIKQKRNIDVIGPGSSYRKLFRALSEGGILALLIDGDVYSGGVETDFFGNRIIFPNGAARLSRHTGAPVIAAYCRRIGDDRSRIHMETIFEPGEASGLSVEEAHGRIMSKLESFILENRDQWCIFRDLREGGS
jgi:KDO2-lipid IV(A) lauroyltransferase